MFLPPRTQRAFCFFQSCWVCVLYVVINLVFVLFVLLGVLNDFYLLLSSSIWWSFCNGDCREDTGWAIHRSLPPKKTKKKNMCYALFSKLAASTWIFSIIYHQNLSKLTFVVTIADLFSTAILLMPLCLPFSSRMSLHSRAPKKKKKKKPVFRRMTPLLCFHHRRSSFTHRLCSLLCST